MLSKSVDLGNNTFIIREALESDVVACSNAFSLMLEEIQDFPENDLTFSASNVSLFTSLVAESIKLGFPPIVAEVNGATAGFCLIIKLFGFETKEQSAQALGSYVYEKYRKLGLSRQMLEFAFSSFKEKGIHKIYGKVFESRPSSSQVITNLGLTEVTVLCKTL